jgi:hypothetical protein
MTQAAEEADMPYKNPEDKRRWEREHRQQEMRNGRSGV